MNIANLIFGAFILLNTYYCASHIKEPLIVALKSGDVVFIEDLKDTSSAKIIIFDYPEIADIEDIVEKIAAVNVTDPITSQVTIYLIAKMKESNNISLWSLKLSENNEFYIASKEGIIRPNTSNVLKLDVSYDDQSVLTISTLNGNITYVNQIFISRIMASKNKERKAFLKTANAIVGNKTGIIAMNKGFLKQNSCLTYLSLNENGKDQLYIDAQHPKFTGSICADQFDEAEDQFYPKDIFVQKLTGEMFVLNSKCQVFKQSLETGRFFKMKMHTTDAFSECHKIVAYPTKIAIADNTDQVKVFRRDKKSLEKNELLVEDSVKVYLNFENPEFFEMRENAVLDICTV